MAFLQRLILLLAPLLVLQAPGVSCVPHRAAVALSPETALRNAIIAANKNGTTVALTLTTDVFLTQPLPALEFGAGIHVQGACARRRRCNIDGQNRFPLFTGQFACSIILESVVVQRMSKSVHYGGCAFTARHVSFFNNTGPSGPVWNIAGAYPSSPGSGQFTDCEFMYNTATTGDGGVIFLGGSVATTVRFSGSVLQANTALKGAGGAIASTGSTLFFYNTKLIANTAAKGGALYLSSSPADFSNIGMWNNRATYGPGGGLLAVDQGSILLRFCTYLIFSNTAPARFYHSNNIFVGSSAGSPDLASVQFCPANNQSYFANFVQTTKNVTVYPSCSGCSGCPKDCSGKGICARDPVDANPYCKCKSGYDSASSCTACSFGLSPSSSCTKCRGGFFMPARQPGTCKICPAADYAQTYLGLVPGSDVYINAAVPANSALQCSQFCRATQPCFGSSSPKCKGRIYCNQWAYIWPTPQAHFCGGKCVLSDNTQFCGIQPINKNATVGVTFQLYEPHLNRCGVAL